MRKKDNGEGTLSDKQPSHGLYSALKRRRRENTRKGKRTRKEKKKRRERTKKRKKVSRRAMGRMGVLFHMIAWDLNTVVVCVVQTKTWTVWSASRTSLCSLSCTNMETQPPVISSWRTKSSHCHMLLS